MDEEGLKNFTALKPRKKAVVILVAMLLALPPLIAMFLNLGPAAWLNAEQSRVLGGYYSGKLTLASLYIIYGLLLLSIGLLIAVPVRLITGKTVVELFSKKGADPVVVIDAIEENGDEYAELCIKNEWWTKRILVVAPDGRYFRVQLDESVVPGVQLRMKGKGRYGGDLYLHVRNYSGCDK